MSDAELPGADLVARGMRDLEGGVMSIEALLVCIGEPRLRAVGVRVPAHEPLLPSPELRLYALLEKAHGDDAHSQYNALLRRLISYEHALEAKGSR